jgi:hypothetical protein
MRDARVGPADNRALPSLAAALFLCIAAIPLVTARVDSLWSSEFAARIDGAEPACLRSGLCFRFSTGRIDRTPSGYSLPLLIENVDNVYRLAKQLDEGALTTVVSDQTAAAKAPRLRPSYDLYINFDEAARRVPASLEWPAPPPARLALAFRQGDEVSQYRTLEITRNDVEKLAALMIGTARPEQIRIGVALAILVLVASTTWIEARAPALSRFGTGALAATLLVRCGAMLAAARIASPTLLLLTVLAVLLPWLALAARILPTNAKVNPFAGSPMAGFYAPAVPSRRLGHRQDPACPIELILLTLSIGVFAYMLWFGDSFRWSIFEERDFLEARRVLSELTVPLYGPELLLGGHTVGGGLYLLLAPVVAVWNDPEALWLFNRLLFLAMAMVLWWQMRAWAGPTAALFSVLALVASARIVALSYWPIHPNFSLFFAFIYACALLRGAVEGYRAWLISSGLLLGFLVQLHFSYFLFVPAHVLLIALGHEVGDRWTKPVAIAAFLLPVAPFLAIDAAHGFPNISQIVERPRFHSLYPNKLFGNASLPALALGWMKQIDGPFAGLASTLTMLMFGSGLVAGIGSVVLTRAVRITPALGAAILFCVPAFELTTLGMGYNTRHTLALVPAMFLLAGFGFAAIVDWTAPEKAWIGTVLVLPFLALLGLRAADSGMLERVSKSEGEWAVDYASRKAIAADIAGRLDMTPQTYAAKTFWWWVGWSVDPEIYREIYRRAQHAAGARSPLAGSDVFTLVTATAELPAFLDEIFADIERHSIAGMYVHVAKLKKPAPLPSGNADTGVRLAPFLQDVDQLRDAPEGFAHIGQSQIGTASRDLFLGATAQGRIKVLLTTERRTDEGGERLRWCIDSPSLNGHYQEFKTLWRPRLVLTPEVGSVAEADLAGEVLGSLAYKAPRCGEFQAARIGARALTFAFEGAFDQSFMSRPDLSRKAWSLDFAAPVDRRSLSATGIAQWLGTRFHD